MLEDYEVKPSITQAEKGEEKVAAKKVFDILGDEIMQFDTETNTFKK